MQLLLQVMRNCCRNRIKFYYCDVERNILHRVTPPKMLVAHNVAKIFALASGRLVALIYICSYSFSSAEFGDISVWTEIVIYVSKN